MGYSKPEVKPLFPPEVLKLSVDQKCEYFHKEVVIKHKRIGEVMSELDVLADPFSGSNIVFLLGGTGVGKSTLLKKYVAKTYDDYRAAMEEDKGFIPIIYVEATSDGQKIFPWKSLYGQMLVELKDVLIGNKIRPLRTEDNKLLIMDDKDITTATLSRAVKSGLKNRQTRRVIIDETIHMVRGTQRGKLPAQLDTFKSLSNQTDVSWILVGCWELYQVACLNGQLARRGTVIDFNRYNDKISGDVKAFKECLCDMQRCLPLHDIPDLMPYSDLLMENSIGCVGLLKDTLRRFLKKALGQDEKWSEELLVKCMLNAQQRAVILEEMLVGERMLEESRNGVSQPERPRRKKR